MHTKTPLRIFVDTTFSTAAEEMLRAGVSPNEIVKPTETASVLASTAASLAGITIALGQPAVSSVLESESLRWVHVTSAGITRYDTPEFRLAAKSRGLLLTNSSSVYDEPCAEQLFAFLLAAARHLPAALQSHTKSGTLEWDKLRYGCRILRGQSVVILGYGAIARHLVQLLTPFQMRISALRRAPKGDESVRIISLAELPTALAEADHVIDILPDNADSRGFFDEKRFAQLKPGAVFYNIGRGTTVDQEALAAALLGGSLAQAWLDVTEPEPLPPAHPLRSLPNCFITPHIGGGHQNESENLVRHFLENYRRFCAGEDLLDRVL